jgi:hypothetical protein
MAASADIILYYAIPDKAYHACPATILAKLYSNSMLAIFNSRIRIVGGRDWSSDSNIISMDTHGELRGDHSTGGPIVFSRTTRTGTSSFGGAIHVEQEVWTDGDGSDIQVCCQLTIRILLD